VKKFLNFGYAGTFSGEEGLRSASEYHDIGIHQSKSTLLPNIWVISQLRKKT